MRTISSSCCSTKGSDSNSGSNAGRSKRVRPVVVSSNPEGGLHSGLSSSDLQAFNDQSGQVSLCSSPDNPSPMVASLLRHIELAGAGVQANAAFQDLFQRRREQQSSVVEARVAQQGGVCLQSSQSTDGSENDSEDIIRSGVEVESVNGSDNECGAASGGVVYVDNNARGVECDSNIGREILIPKAIRPVSHVAHDDVPGNLPGGTNSIFCFFSERTNNVLASAAQTDQCIQESDKAVLQASEFAFH